MCFPVNFVKFLRTATLQNTSGRLLLHRSLTHQLSQNRRPGSKHVLRSIILENFNNLLFS